MSKTNRFTPSKAAELDPELGEVVEPVLVEEPKETLAQPKKAYERERYGKTLLYSAAADAYRVLNSNEALNWNITVPQFLRLPAPASLRGVLEQLEVGIGNKSVEELERILWTQGLFAPENADHLTVEQAFELLVKLHLQEGK